MGQSALKLLLAGSWQELFQEKNVTANYHQTIGS